MPIRRLPRPTRRSRPSRNWAVPKTAKLQAAKGEALICRAYAHWVLVNMFCMHYNTNHPDDLGVPYMEHAETELNPKYSRER